MAESIRVLIADDEIDVCESLKGMLLLDRQQRYKVEIITSPDKILSTIEDFKPHVVLLDNYFENEIVGIDQYLPAIRGRFKTVRVIIITARRGGDNRQILKSYGFQASDFLDKQGLSNERIREAVKEAYKELQGL